MSFTRLVQRIKDGLTAEPAVQQSHDDRLRLATAAVLLEIAYADGSFSPAEDGNVLGFLQQQFKLSADDARELVETAAEIRGHTIDHFAMTNFIRKNVPLSERIEIVKTMWRTAYSDGRLTDYESYLVRKLADLLGLEHHVMIDAKVSVLREIEAT
ncbi:MAG TPA: TerB family tellurite resistance protein [Thermoanaerobaculia bacterium]